MSDSEPGASLRDAHPDFATHFTRAAYDPTHPDFEDDIPPFGSDEGWDEVYIWSERGDELLANPTLRYMIENGQPGSGADGFVAELVATEQVDLDDTLIGMGFALLRYTGHIDPEGRGWLRDALVRQLDHGAGDHYQLLINDLESFKPEPSESETAQTSIRVPMRWVSISGGNSPGLTRWLGTIAKSLNGDSTWTRWWSTIPFARLGLYVVPVVPTDGREVHIDFDAERDPRHLQVVGATAALGKSLLHTSREGEPGIFAWGASRATHELCAALVRQMLRETGTYTGVRTPSDIPPPL